MIGFVLPRDSFEQPGLGLSVPDLDPLPVVSLCLWPARVTWAQARVPAAAGRPRD